MTPPNQSTHPKQLWMILMQFCPSESKVQGLVWVNPSMEHLKVVLGEQRVSKEVTSLWSESKASVTETTSVLLTFRVTHQGYVLPVFASRGTAGCHLRVQVSSCFPTRPLLQLALKSKQKGGGLERSYIHLCSRPTVPFAGNVTHTLFHPFAPAQKSSVTDTVRQPRRLDPFSLAAFCNTFCRSHPESP